MATHYVYGEVDSSSLCQGDVLKRSPGLIDLLRQYHPHYADHRDYRYFVVLTQSCDLVRRKGADPKAQYISLAAARTLQETILREAVKHQAEWQQELKVIGTKGRVALSQFVSRIIDNNEAGYFYLHEDQDVGIAQSCCAYLPLSVAVRSQHYELLLEAKIAQLKDSFQAKLGWLVGNMYSRVGTTEWDTEYTDLKLRDFVDETLSNTLIHISDEKIKEGLAELSAKGELAHKNPQEILDHLQKTVVQKKSKKFEVRAIEYSQQVKLIDRIQGRAKALIWDGLKEQILELLRAEKIENEEALADAILGVFSQRYSATLNDRDFPDREKVVAAFIRGILQDTQVSALLN